MASEREKAKKSVDPRDAETANMLLELEDQTDRMNAWEKNFIESITDWFLMKELRLTDNQFDKLKQIYERLC